MFSTILSLTRCRSLMSFRKLQLDKSILKTTSRFGWSQMLLLHIMQPLHCHNQRETTGCFLRPIWTNPRCRCTTTTTNPTSLTSCSQRSDWQVKLSGSHTNFDCAWFLVWLSDRSMHRNARSTSSRSFQSAKQKKFGLQLRTAKPQINKLSCRIGTNWKLRSGIHTGGKQGTHTHTLWRPVADRWPKGSITSCHRKVLPTFLHWSQLCPIVWSTTSTMLLFKRSSLCCIWLNTRKMARCFRRDQANWWTVSTSLHYVKTRLTQLARSSPRWTVRDARGRDRNKFHFDRWLHPPDFIKPTTGRIPGCQRSIIRCILHFCISPILFLSTMAQSS